MTKADLHVHTKFSSRSSTWLWQRFGLSESFTEPEDLYRAAKAQGMDLVTVTDHDAIEGALELKAAHPEDVISGVEATAVFPEDGCKVHVLIWGLDEGQFQDVQYLRTDLYALRDYLSEQELAHAVAHATYAVNGRLSLAHLEKLILLFDVFEGLNGGRNRLHNDAWSDLLGRLTPAHIEALRRRHQLEPMSEGAWIKGLTGGSDDHAGLFVGQTYTVAAGDTPQAFLDHVRQRLSRADGRQNDFQSLAFTLYKLTHDFAAYQGAGAPNPLLEQLNALILRRHTLSIKDKLRIKAVKSVNKKGAKLERLGLELIDDLQSRSQAPLDDKLHLVYRKIAAIADDYVQVLCRAVEKDLAKGHLTRLVRDVTTFLPGALLAVPFLSTLRHLHQGRPLIEALRAELGLAAERPKRILWFTDTLGDMNGVAVTLRKIGWLTQVQGYPVSIVTSLAAKELRCDLPPNVINLPAVHRVKLPSYETYALQVPSLLTAFERLERLEPDEIYISTPGPLGLLGLLVARVLSVPCLGIYHTDFTAQARELVGDESVIGLVEGYSHWFYGQMDTLRVPTQAYVELLTQRGLDPARMQPFPRGIDLELFQPLAGVRGAVLSRLGLPEGETLLYVGRVSRDKRLEFLAEVYVRLLKAHPTLNLIIAGDGPYLATLRQRLSACPRVAFTGRLAHEALPELYSAADLFVFPSTADTHGLAVLEAQACGLPAIVSDVGGPQEIIAPHETGWIIPAEDLQAWTEAVAAALALKQRDPAAWGALHQAARTRVAARNDWGAVLEELLGAPPSALPVAQQAPTLYPFVADDPALADLERAMALDPASDGRPGAALWPS